MNSTHVKPRSPIAIVGMACRFPGARDIRDFWRLLIDNKSSIVPYTGVRLLSSPKMLIPSKASENRWWGPLDGIDMFDAGFFKISPREAALMDPQQRIALEVAYGALEDAGLTASLSQIHNTSVFVASINNEYQELALAQSDSVDVWSATGGGRSSIASRISHAFDFNSISLSLDSDRSSSLVALRLAIDSIHNGTSRTALVGGVNLILSPNLTDAFNNSAMLSRSGKVSFGDQQADGFIRSEGVGFIVLKSLEQAILDKDRIYSLVMNTNIAQQGAANADIKSPSPRMQEKLISDCYSTAKISPNDIVFIEAHGTGTPVGDRVELHAIGNLMKSRDSKCLVGSVKTNIGHTEAVAGIAGIIKSSLAIYYRELPASLNFINGPPESGLKNWKISIPTKNVSLAKRNRRIYAGVSSFGLTGTIGHTILAESLFSRRRRNRAPRRSTQLIALTSDNAEKLKSVASDLKFQISNDSQLENLADLSYTSLIRRPHHKERILLIVSSIEELLFELDRVIETGFQAMTSKFLETDKRLGLKFGDDVDGASGAIEYLNSFPGFNKDRLTLEADYFRLSRIEPRRLTGSEALQITQLALVKFTKQIGLDVSVVNSPEHLDFLREFSLGVISAEDSLLKIYDTVRLPATYQKQDRKLASGADDYQFIALGCNLTEIDRPLKDSFARAICAQFVRRIPISFGPFFNGQRTTNSTFPGYVWSRKRFWYTNLIKEDLNKQVSAQNEKAKQLISFLAQSDDAQRTKAIQSIVFDQLQLLLGPYLPDRIERELPLNLQGVSDDSLAALKKSLEFTFDIRLPSSVFEIQPTISAMINYLSRNWMRRPKNLGDILIADKLITESQVQKTLEEQSLNKGQRFGSILVKNDLISQQDLNNALAVQATDRIRVVSFAYKQDATECTLATSLLESLDEALDQASLDRAYLKRRNSGFFVLTSNSSFANEEFKSEWHKSLNEIGVVTRLGPPASIGSTIHLACRSLLYGEVDIAIVSCIDFNEVTGELDSSSTLILTRDNFATFDKLPLLGMIAYTSNWSGGIRAKHKLLESLNTCGIRASRLLEIRLTYQRPADASVVMDEFSNLFDELGSKIKLNEKNGESSITKKMISLRESLTLLSSHNQLSAENSAICIVDAGEESTSSLLVMEAPASNMRARNYLPINFIFPVTYTTTASIAEELEIISKNIEILKPDALDLSFTLLMRSQASSQNKIAFVAASIDDLLKNLAAPNAEPIQEKSRKAALFFPAEIAVGFPKLLRFVKNYPEVTRVYRQIIDLAEQLKLIRPGTVETIESASTLQLIQLSESESKFVIFAQSVILGRFFEFLNIGFERLCGEDEATELACAYLKDLLTLQQCLEVLNGENLNLDTDTSYSVSNKSMFFSTRAGKLIDHFSLMSLIQNKELETPTNDLFGSRETLASIDIPILLGTYSEQQLQLDQISTKIFSNSRFEHYTIEDYLGYFFTNGFEVNWINYFNVFDVRRTPWRVTPITETIIEQPRPNYKSVIETESDENILNRIIKAKA